MKYERITKRTQEYGVITLCPACPFSHNGICTENDRVEAETTHCIEAVYDRLAELEDKIESGELDFSCNVPKDETDCVLLQAKYDIALRKYAKLRRIVTHYNVMTKTVDNEITEEAEARLKELQGE